MLLQVWLTFLCEYFEKMSEILFGFRDPVFVVHLVMLIIKLAATVFSDPSCSYCKWHTHCSDVVFYDVLSVHPCLCTAFTDMSWANYCTFNTSYEFLIDSKVAL